MMYLINYLLIAILFGTGTGQDNKKSNSYNQDLPLIIEAFVSIEKGPSYASEETKEVIEKMIEAHGGYEQWRSIKTMSFKNVMHSESLGMLRFWVKEQWIDMETRRSYQEWPVVQSTMTYDGEKAWSTNWQMGNPPNHQHSVYLYYVNLPWLTQDEGVNLSEVEKVSHHAFENEVYKITMSYTESPILGKSAKDTYILFIDSESYLLLGYEYTVGYGPMLDVMNIPKDREFIGPMLRLNNYIGEVNGIKLPMLMSTHNSDKTTQYGDHIMYDFQFNFEFDESKMIKPENAVVDKSVDKRK